MATLNVITQEDLQLTRQAVREAAEHEARTQAQFAEQSAIAPSVSPVQIAALFERWNASLQTLDPEKVVANYAPRSVLLPTLSDRCRITREEKLDYFGKFLADRPAGMIDQRTIMLTDSTALDVGLYTFHFGANDTLAQCRYTFTYGWDGSDWLITSHHSSLMPGRP